MKNLILATVLTQFLVVVPFLAYSVKKGYWSFSFKSFRILFHFLFLAALVTFSGGLNPIVLLVYFAITLEEFASVGTLNRVYDALFRAPEPSQGASIRPTVRFGIFSYFFEGLRIDTASLATIIVNLVDTRKIFNPDHCDPVARFEGKNTSIFGIIFDPSHIGHETLRAVTLGLLLVL